MVLFQSGRAFNKFTDKSSDFFQQSLFYVLQGKEIIEIITIYLITVGHGGGWVLSVVFWKCFKLVMVINTLLVFHHVLSKHLFFRSVWSMESFNVLIPYFLSVYRGHNFAYVYVRESDRGTSVDD